MAEWIGRTIGNYRVEGPLGAGGMGQVFRARHIHLEREIALKVLHNDFAHDSGFVARFRQEARAAAALRHPNIVEVYDFGEQEGICYLAMELVTGGALRSLLRRRTEPGKSEWSLPLGLEMVREAARALDFAHSSGVVHRDVKPDNILLLPQTGGTFPYSARLSDFGLARLAENSIRTASGVTMGTPAYISPEQCRGEDVDGRSDLYSLGIVLYEVATGLLPFSVKTLTDAVYKHVHTEAPSPRSVCPTLSPELEAVILKCIAKNPEDRYATGAALDAALDSVPESLSPTPGKPVKTVQNAAPEAMIGTPTVNNGNNGSGGAGGGRPPLPVSVLGTSLLPRVQALDADGRLLETREVGGDGLTIGRLPGSDIMLDDAAVSRHHLRLDWDGTVVIVTDLGSSNGSFLSRRRLAPQMATRWTETDALQAGPFFLRLIAPTVPKRAEASAAAPVGNGASPRGLIGVALEEESLILAPGKPEALRITAANLGSQVEHLTVEVEGVPETWVQAPPRPTQLNPGTQATIALSIEAPRLPQSRVGEYPVTVRVRSHEIPERFGEAVGRWTVLPFEGGNVMLSPLKNGGTTQAHYTLNLRNDGNAHARWTLSASDDEQALTYDFDAPKVDLQPGQTSSTRLTVQSPRRIIGTPQMRPFTIRAEPVSDGGGGRGGSGVSAAAQTLTGQFVHRAYLPPWVPVAALAVLAATPMLWKTLTAKEASPTPVPVPTPTQLVQASDGGPSPLVPPPPLPTSDDSAAPLGVGASPVVPPLQPSPSVAAPTPTLAPPTPAPTPTVDTAPHAAEVQRVALARLKILRDRLQSARATLDALKAVPPAAAGLPVGGMSLTEAKKAQLSGETIKMLRKFDSTGIASSRSSRLSEIIRKRGIHITPATAPPAGPDLSQQKAAADRMPELGAHVAQLWGAIAGYGMGDRPLTQPFSLSTSVAATWDPEAIQDFGAPQFNPFGLPDLYSLLLQDQHRSGTQKSEAEQEFGLITKRYSRPTDYPLKEIQPHFEAYRTAPADIGGTAYKADMAAIDQWLASVEGDINSAEARFR